MFIDEVKIKVISGKGGDGIVSWRREKYIPKGGPWGGDGGKGGDVYILTDTNLNTLSDFRHKKVWKALNGENGGKNNMHGSDADDLYLKVPVGTLIKDANSNNLIVDLSENNVKYLIAKGGRGGYGNAHFASSIRQIPRFAELGDIAEEKDIILELKLVADIGIIGLPSSGKSTLISTITNVKAKIGDYPFTTLSPNLGVLDYKGKTLIIEDVPGLIPGASEGKGLGIEFLKHIERTNVLVHLLDIYRLDYVFEDYELIRKELEKFSQTIAKKDELIVFSKSDLLDDEMKNHILNEFKKKYKNKKIFLISSVTGEGVNELKDFLITNYADEKNEEEKLNNNEIKVYDLKENNDPKKYTLEFIEGYTFKVSGERIEQIVRMTDFSNIEAVARIYDVLEKMGIIKTIERELDKILNEEKIDNSSFFEGNDDDTILPKVIISGKEIPLDKLRYNL